MDRPRPRIVTNLAAIFVRSLSAAKMKVQQARSELQAANAKSAPLNREARRYRDRHSWWGRRSWGLKGAPSSNVLRGYEKRYSHCLSGSAEKSGTAGKVQRAKIAKQLAQARRAEARKLGAAY